MAGFARPVTAGDYRHLASRRLPRFLFDYVDGGANDERTMAANVADFAAVRLRQRVLHDVRDVDASTTLAGRPASFPLVLAPVGMAGLMARRGEVQAASAADRVGVPFTLSTLGVCTLDELRAASDTPCWFQLYMLRDRGVVRELLARAAAAGCRTLVFTVDLAVAGMRHRDARNGMLEGGLRSRLAKARQIAVRPRWIYDVALRGRPHTVGNLSRFVPNPTDVSAYKRWIDEQFDPSVTWDDIRWLRDLWPGHLLIKGILEPDDAASALAAGANGVIVSNHGGRQLDGVASGVAKLPAVVDAVRGRGEVYLDGGVRSGIDVLKALALGANAVTIGRPWVWALAGAGRHGLVDYLAVLKREVEVGMALAGVRRIGDVTSDVLDRTAPRG